ncbi:hypothetical protein [Cytobacillus oceanisediminis]|uniref:hypothetical protein n=1 Tax=Cytobacillus oceanisediminis TaxID=665099 RepID=UPI00207981C0|nr:hypothetical protein [Cytobacillus oceanisediminis]USK44634.1 hypothetical protein LIT27_01685 [Cytobacillus oceanisediminis]
MKKLLTIFAALFVFLSFNTAASANTIIDKSTINMIAGGEYTKMTTRPITVPKGAWLGVYFDNKGVTHYGMEWMTFEVYSPDTGERVIQPQSADYNNVIGVPAGRYILEIDCFIQNGSYLGKSNGCSATGILSSQYK